MKQLIAANGEVNPVVQYLGFQKGRWLAAPAVTGTQMKPPHARMDLFKQHMGMDLQKMYPSGADPDKELASKWTWDAFLGAAEKAHKAGYPFGMPLGDTSDAVDWVGSVFNSHGSTLIDSKGNITVKSDATKQVLEWFKKIVPFLPPDVFAWDDASNNRWLISGKGALIMNPPSAWAVAKRDNPQVAEQCWYMGCPAGPKGRFGPFLPYFWGIWNFSKNKDAAKSLLAHLWQRSSVEKLVAASQGYDLPSFSKLNDFKTWAEEGPPKGGLWHYPNRGDQIQSITASPAPPPIAVQVYNQATHTKMVARVTQTKESIDQTIAWAEKELEGFLRT
jgi:ABC-type glycerol-3-phosphate transport system substrate-binding protein